MENNNLQQTNQEIDLIFLNKKIKSMFDSIGFFIFKSIRFFIKNIFIFICLIIIGLIISVLSEKNIKKIGNEIVVIPNFGSTEYLYSMIENYRNIYTNNDKEKIYLNNITDIQISPIININNFINNPNNQEFFKTLTSSGLKFEDFFKNKDIEKSNKQFLITVYTKNEKYSKESINFILNKLNSSNYYSEKSKIEIRNLKENKIQLKKSIEQIDLILNNLGSSENKDKLNTYENLNNIISLKNEYINKLLSIDNILITSSKIVYPINFIYNKKIEEKLYYNTRILYPFALISIFIIFNIFKRFYNKYNRL